MQNTRFFLRFRLRFSLIKGSPKFTDCLFALSRYSDLHYCIDRNKYRLSALRDGVSIVQRSFVKNKDPTTVGTLFCGTVVLNGYLIAEAGERF